MFGCAGGSIGRLYACLYAALSLFAVATTANGQTIIDWNNAAGGSYHVAANWNPANVPDTASETARFNFDEELSVSFNANSSTTIDDLLVLQGDLLFRNGGFANDATLNISGDAILDGGHLTLARTISNADVNLAVAQFLSIDGGSELTLSDEAMLSAGGVDIGVDGVGVLTLEDQTLLENNGAARIAVNTGANATVTVRGEGSIWSNSSALTVGSFFGTGTLTIESGGTVSNTTGTIANQTSSMGAVTVSGQGSSWNNSSLLRIGGLGTAVLTIEDGGSVSSVSSDIGADISVNHGEVIVSGTDGNGNSSTWTNNGALRVGASGRGMLTIEDGGSVSSNSVDIGFAGFGRGFGEVTVSGDGSTLTSGTLTVGDFGRGMLTIVDGGSVSNTTSVIANQSGSIGEVTVSGQGSTWTNSDVLTVGRLGRGTLSIEDGGRVSNLNSFIGRIAGSSGEVTLTTGQLSEWEMSGHLSIGGDAVSNTNGGTGTLTIGHINRVSVAGDTVVFPDGLVVLNGGTLTTNALDNRGGQIAWSSGRLQLTGSGLTIGTGPLGQWVAVGPSLLSGAFLDVADTLTIDDGALLSMAGDISAGAVVNNGDLILIGSLVEGPVTNAAGANITVVENVAFTGPVDGPGGFFGPGMITFAGGMSPGASPAQVTFESDATFHPSNTLFIEIGGTASGTDYDTLSFGGTAMLGGALDVELINAFTPELGDLFDIITADGGVVDTFATESLPEIGSFLKLQLIYEVDSVTLAVVPALAGDFNTDGVVNAADYVVWRKNDGTQEAYNQWRANFGASSSGGSFSNAAVPEAASLTTLFIGALAIYCLRVRKA